MPGDTGDSSQKKSWSLALKIVLAVAGSAVALSALVFFVLCYYCFWRKTNEGNELHKTKPPTLAVVVEFSLVPIFFAIALSLLAFFSFFFPGFLD